jgi:hypothetical protein
MRFSELYFAKILVIKEFLAFFQHLSILLSRKNIYYSFYPSIRRIIFLVDRTYVIAFIDLIFLSIFFHIYYYFHNIVFLLSNFVHI